MSKLPEAFAARIKAEWPDEADAFFAALDSPYTRGIRMNPGKRCALPEAAAEKIPWAQDAYYLALDSAAGGAVTHEAGAYYLQEPSAMIPAAVLNPKPGERVLDLCAAPGGKATQLAAMLSKEGVLVANEPNAARARILSSNIERMGVENAVVISAMPQALCACWAEWFDKILVDAPCSGEGMFRRHPEAMAEWTAGAPLGCAVRQRQILDCAAQMLRPGGYLVYSTCTFSREENEGQIAAFLSEHKEFALEPFSLPGLQKAGPGMLRVWPHRARGEGHFAALLKKAGDGAARDARLLETRCDKREEALCRAFFTSDMCAPAPERIISFMGRLVAPPAAVPPLDKIKALRLGLTLGQVKGALFFPDHALAMARSFSRVMPLSERDARRWLHGEALPAGALPRGFAAPVFGGLQLGFGKVSDGQLKNHYPKGLRK